MELSPLIYLSENIHNLMDDEKIIGHYLFDDCGEGLGRVEGLYVEHFTYYPRYLVYSQGGFLSTSGKIILVPNDLFEVIDMGKVKILKSLQWLKDIHSPANAESLTRGDEELILDYYNLPPYWPQETNEKTDQDSAA